MSPGTTDTFEREYHRVRLSFDPERGKVRRALSCCLSPWLDANAGLLDLGAGYGDFSRFSKASAKSALDRYSEPIGHCEDSVRPTIQSTGLLGTMFAPKRLQPRRHFDAYTHKAIFTAEGFRGLLGASGFRVVRSEPRFTPLTMKSRWPKAEWMVDLYLPLPFRPLAGQFLVIAEPSGN